MTDQAAPDPQPAAAVDDDLLESTMLDLLGKRAVTSSICPSDAARAGGEEWRELMDDTRRVAWRLVDEGRVRITQGDEAVDRETVRGPIRIRWATEVGSDTEQ
jgi:hypothetical protein